MLVGERKAGAVTHETCRQDHQNYQRAGVHYQSSTARCREGLAGSATEIARFAHGVLASCLAIAVSGAGFGPSPIP